MQMNPHARMVNPDMSLVERYTIGQISNATKNEIERQSREVLRTINPLLYHICRVRLVCNPRRNFITFYIDSDYETLVHHVQTNNVYYCFMVSSKLEPFIIITAVCPHQGKLVRLTQSQIVDLMGAIDSFKKKYSVVRESYHYTSLSERTEDSAFNAGNNAVRSHSQHFHLKMRIATRMLIDLFPAARLVDIELLKARLEPVQHFFSRECVSYEDVHTLMKKDAV